MTARRTRTPVPYMADQMFDLVADVERYPDFLPWCVALRVLQRDEENGLGKVSTEMVVSYKTLREKFRSTVILDRANRRIDVEYNSGPFRRLHNLWVFEDEANGGSMINFEIDFEFKSMMLHATASLLFEKAFAKMSDAFVKRADEVYGS